MQSFKIKRNVKSLVFVILFSFSLLLLIPTVNAGATPGTLDQIQFAVYSESGGNVDAQVGTDNTPVTVSPDQQIFVVVQGDWSALSKDMDISVCWRAWEGTWSLALEKTAGSASDWEYWDSNYATLDVATCHFSNNLECTYLEDGTTDANDPAVGKNELWYILEVPTVEERYELVISESGCGDIAETITTAVEIWNYAQSGMTVKAVTVPSSIFKSTEFVVNATVTNYDDAEHNNTNITLDISGAGDTSGWTVVPGLTQKLNFTNNKTKYVIFNVTPTSGATAGSYTANVSEDYNNTNKVSSSIQLIPLATGTPNMQLNWWMMAEGYIGSDKVEEQGEFDDCPIVLNDYGNTTAKCEIWDCDGWTANAALGKGRYCDDWNCTEWNNDVTCSKYECGSEWGEVGVADRLDYCEGGYNCTSWASNGVCDNWHCLTRVSVATTKDDAVCTGVWNCTSWSGTNTCDCWTCTEWTSALADLLARYGGDPDKNDYYCSGAWNCINWDASGGCDNWNCTQWTEGTTEKAETYCSGVLNCTAWNQDDYCENWECSAHSESTVGNDAYCDQWSCITWDETRKVCETWNCSSGWTEGAAEKDVYCSGGFSCLGWKEFAPAEDLIKPDITIVYPSNNTNWSNLNLRVNYTASDDVALFNCWYSNDTYTKNTTLTNCGTNISISWSEGKHNVTVWANDTSGNINWSSVSFRIDTTKPYFTTIPNAQSVEYNQRATGVDFEATDETQFDSYVVNDSRFQINSTGWFNDTEILEVGNYYINITINDSVNNLNSTIYNVNITKNVSLVLGLTAPTPIEYPNATEFTESLCPSELECSLNLTNGVFGAGTISANYSTAGNNNYSASSKTFTVTINQNTSLVLGIDGATPIDYGTFTNVEGSDCPTELVCTLDKSNIIYGVDVSPITFNYSTAGNNNYSAASITKDITIDQATPTGALTNTLTTWTINETQEVTIGRSESNNGDDDLTYVVYRDGVSKTTGETWSPALGTYNYVLNTTGGTNWSANANMDSQTLTVLDNIKPDISIVYPSNNTNWTNVNLDVNFTRSDTNLFNCWYSNDTYTTNSTPDEACNNITSMVWSEGQHNVTIWANDTSGNINWSSISFTIDTIPPYFTNWANQSVTIGDSLAYNITASDDGIGLESFAINWTTQFNITISDGVLRNSSALGLGEYYVNVSINDTLGNLNSSILLVNVSESADTCTCAGLNQNWEVDMSHYCELDTACNLGTGNLTFTGSGYANCSANINTTNLGDPGSGGILYISGGCLIYVS